jgi:beta-lactamase superfamily II metal-dependent hydrolase
MITKTTPDNDSTPTFTWGVASDNTSGVACYAVGIDSGGFTCIYNTTTYTVTEPLPDGTHTFEVKAIDEARNEVFSYNLTFTVKTPIGISNINVSNITDSSATISWTTDVLATSRVPYYRVGDCWRCFGHLDKELTTSHGVTLTGLDPDATHRFRVCSIDEAGHEATSTECNFTTNMAELSVHFIDVGQGDAILVDVGHFEVLIDGGGESSRVVDYIDDYVDGDLEAIVATNPHDEYIGGLIEVLAAFKVQAICLSGGTSTSKTYSQFMSAVNNTGRWWPLLSCSSEDTFIYQVGRGDIIKAGDDVTVNIDGFDCPGWIYSMGCAIDHPIVLQVLHPVDLSDTPGNNSIVLHLAYGDIDFLFMGGADQEAEGSMLKAGIVPDVEILKVGQHGSRTASSQAFLGVTQPEVAIYMAGFDNPYGYPHERTISALENIGADIYGTDVDGTIIVITDGKSYEVQTER